MGLGVIMLGIVLLYFGILKRVANHGLRVELQGFDHGRA
jgi:hypothetical protein